MSAAISVSIAERDLHDKGGAFALLSCNVAEYVGNSDTLHTGIRATTDNGT